MTSYSLGLAVPGRGAGTRRGPDGRAVLGLGPPGPPPPRRPDRLIRHHLHGLHERAARPSAGCSPRKPSIYRRFGYGEAGPGLSLHPAARCRAARPSPAPDEISDPAGAARTGPGTPTLVDDVFAAARCGPARPDDPAARRRPAHLLRDQPERHRGAELTQLVVARARRASRPATRCCAARMDWQDGTPTGTVEVIELVGAGRGDRSTRSGPGS